jgi:hypothetical protein
MLKIQYLVWILDTYLIPYALTRSAAEGQEGEVGVHLYKRHICCMLVCKYVKKTVLELGFMVFMVFMVFMGFRHLPRWGTLL